MLDWNGLRVNIRFFFFNVTFFVLFNIGNLQHMLLEFEIIGPSIKLNAVWKIESLFPISTTLDKVQIIETRINKTNQIYIALRNC